jgi:uncharacterized membrane protein YhhN
VTGGLIWLCAGATLALVASSASGWRLGVWLTKPVASAAFVGVALSLGALDTGYGRLVLAGLCLSWLGDVLLIPRERPLCFQAGILAFLLAHVAYATAFFGRGLSPTPFALGVVAAGVFSRAALRWLRPHVPADFQIPVIAYVTVICTMLVAALTAFVETGNGLILLGAVMFAVSDLSVARDRFVTKSALNEAWGLPLYFAAQVVLAWSVI